MLWFWWPHPVAWAAPAAGFTVAGLLTWRLPAGPVRRFCVSLLAFDALSTAVFIGYATLGIDFLSPAGYYIGYFYWSAPVITVLVAVLAVVEASWAARRPALSLAAAVTAAVAAGRPIVLRLAHDAWPSMTGLLVQAERTGVTACVADPCWEFMVTSQFICSPAELSHGRQFRIFVPGEVPSGTPVLFRLRRGIVTSTAPGT